MECKRYSNWIEDAALDSLDAARAAELRLHLLKCSLCAQQLEREQRLLVAVDQAMAQSLAVDTPDDLHVRVRQKIAEEAKAGFPFSLSHAVTIAAACAVVVAVAAVFVWLPRHPIARRQTTEAALTRRAARPSPPVILSEAKNPAPRVGPSPLTRLAPRIPLSRGGRTAISPDRSILSLRERMPDVGGRGRELPHRFIRRPSHRETTPEVLVPKNEMALVLELYNGVRTGKIDGASLLTTPPGFNRGPDGTLVAAPLKIEPIKISEIKPVGISTELQ